MALSTGLGASLGVATETTYGTYAAPTRFAPTFNNESLAQQPDFVRTTGLRPDVVAQQDGLHTQTTRHGEGNVAITPVTGGFGPWLNLLHGNTVTPDGAGDAKTQVHEIGESVPDGKSLTAQIGIPGTDGVRYGKNALGVTCDQVEFSIDSGGVVESSWTLHARDIVPQVGAPVTPVYPAEFEAFGFLGSTLQLDGGAVGACVKGAKITIALPKNKERYCLNGSGLTLAPLTNGPITVNGEFALEFAGWAQYQAFVDSTRTEVDLVCSGTRVEIEPGVYGSLGFHIPKVVRTSGTPSAAGSDIVTTTVQWEAVTDGTEPLATISTVSADTAV